MQPVYDFGGNGPVLHLAIANGFPPQTYQPFADLLTKRFHVVCLPPRALWPGEKPPETLIEWNKSLAIDLLNGLREHNYKDLVAVGHSFGGIATLLCAIAEPHRFKAVVLLDPTILPHRYMWALKAARWLGVKRGIVLAERASKRRESFESIEEAYEYFKGKRLFADWHPDAVRLYAESLKPSAEGGVTLAWPREWEAYYFRAFYSGTWAELPKLRGIVPLLTIRGGESDTLQAKSAEYMRRILPEMAYAEVSGHGHLFPQSAPEETYRIIADWLETVG